MVMRKRRPRAKAKRISDKAFESGEVLGAETVFHHLANRFAQESRRVKDGPLPRDLDITACACLMLASDYQREFVGLEEAVRASQRCINIMAGRPYPEIDLLPWILAKGIILGGEEEKEGIERLVCNLSHHNSSIRGFVLDLAWFVRSKLPFEPTVLFLMNNVANTLIYVPESLSLAWTLMRSNPMEGFLARYTPPDGFEDQFKERIEQLTDKGEADVISSGLEGIELAVRRTIDDFILAQPARKSPFPQQKELPLLNFVPKQKRLQGT